MNNFCSAAAALTISRLRRKLAEADTGVGVRVLRGLRYRLELVPMNKSHGYSLRRRLLVHLWAPPLLVLILGAVGAFALARYIGSVVYDN